MKKRIISMAMSVVVAISALPLFSSCSGGIGGTNINQELVKNLELDQNDISILVKPFEVIDIARNELNSKSNITNEDLQNFSNTIYDAFYGSKDNESDASDISNEKHATDILSEKYSNVVENNEAMRSQYNTYETVVLNGQSSITQYHLGEVDVLMGGVIDYLPIMRYKDAVSLLNFHSELLYGKEMISEEEINKVSENNIRTSYKDNLKITLSKILKSSAKAEKICKLTMKVWHNSIYKEHDTETDAFTMENGSYFYDDFNDALKNLYNDGAFQSDISSLEADQKEITEIVKIMKDAPEEFSSTYDDLKQLYTAYQTYSGLAVNSSGSYNSYSDNVEKSANEVIECYNKLKLYID